MKPILSFFHRRDLRIAGLLFLLFLFTYVFFKTAVVNVNCVTRLAFCLAILEDGTATIDRYEQYTSDKSQANGHYYCDKAPGASFLTFPVVAAGYHVFRLMGIDDYTTPRENAQANAPWPNRNFEMMLLVGSLTVSLTCALAVATFYLLGIIMGVSRKVALVAALLLGIGTPYWFWATILFGHSLAAAFLILGLYGGLRLLGRDEPSKTPARYFGPAWIGVGFLLAYAVLVEYPCAVISILIGIFFLSQLISRRATIVDITRVTGFLLLGALPVAAGFFIYNTVCFGSPLTLGYQVEAGDYPEMLDGFFGIRLPDPEVVWKTSFSFRQGLFWYSPFLVLSPILAIRNIYRNRARGLNLLALAGFLFFFFLNASYAYWHHTFIPCRHMTPGLPFAVIPFLFRDGESRWFARTANLLITLTLVVRVIAFFAPQDKAFYVEHFGEFSFVRMTFAAAGFNLPTLAGFPAGVSMAFPLLVWSVLALLLWRDVHAEDIILSSENEQSEPRP